MNLVQVVALYQNILCTVNVGLDSLFSYREQGAERGFNLEVVVAVYTGYFLNQVSLYCNVLCCTPRGHVHSKHLAVLRNAEAERYERFNDFLIGNLYTRVLVYIGLININCNLFVVTGVSVCHFRCNPRLGSYIKEQLYKSLGSRFGELGVENLLVSHTCIGAESKTGGGLSYANTVEVCRFKNNG